MKKKDSSADDFNYQIITPARKGLNLSSSVYIALIIVLAFAILTAVHLNILISHVQIVSIPPDIDEEQQLIEGNTLDIPYNTPLQPSMPLSAFGDGIYSRTLLFSAIWVIIDWPIIAWVLKQAAGGIFGGTGKFYPDMLAGIGYTYLIKIAAIIPAILLVSWMPVYEINYAAFSNSDMAADEFQHFLDNNPYFQLSDKIKLAGLIISSCYGVLIVKKIEKIKLWQAAAVVGVPLIAYLILNYFQIIS